MAKSRLITSGFDMKVKFDDLDVVCQAFGLTNKPEFQLFGEDEGMTGSPHPEKCRRTNVKNEVSGELLFKPTYTELAKYISNFFTSVSVNDYTLLDAFHVDMTATNPAGSFPVLLDASAQGFTYTNCVCNTFTIRFSENNPVEVALEVMARSESAGSVTVGSAECSSIVASSDLTLTLGADEYYAIDGELVVTRNLITRYNNDTNLTSVTNGKTDVTFTSTIDYNTDTQTDLFANTGTNNSIPFNLAFGDGTDAISFDVPEAVLNSPTPERPGDGEFTPSIELKGSYNLTDPIITATVVLA